jgi:hypothetical protein
MDTLLIGVLTLVGIVLLNRVIPARFGWEERGPMKNGDAR